ncbi:MAG: Trm112 family protein [Thiofilum sp.]|uniref:Trm112 family protein n=1 Tax=Thiofilum sp. TaxID=2212733 RepID=UPI0025D5C2B6|nr:Trm112 family protein [Thiofilum sp.]MBK8451833.1 Trm112 family protein [Thiofilum sp.]
MQKQLLAILVCPVTKGALVYNKEAQELISYAARLAYPIKEGVPMLLEDEARPLTDDELEHRLS